MRFSGITDVSALGGVHSLALPDEEDDGANYY
jgi:hypothetical protein